MRKTCIHCDIPINAFALTSATMCEICADTKAKGEMSFDTLMGMVITEGHDNAKENGYFEPGEQLHNCTAEDFAADMIAYDGVPCDALDRWGDSVVRAYIVKYAQQHLGMK